MSWKKAAALFLLIVLFAGMLGGFGAPSVSATEEEDDLRDKIDELEEELERLKQQIEDAKTAAEQAKERAETYRARAAIVKEQIRTLQKAIDLKSEELAIKQKELDAKQMERDETYALFKQRVRAMYMNNNVSMISLILGADSFSEFLVAAKTQSSISRHDTELVDKLDRETKEIEAAKEVIEKDLEEYLRSNRYELRETSSVRTDYSQDPEGGYLAALSLYERGRLLCKLQMHADTEDEAARMADRFRKRHRELYETLYRELLLPDQH